MLDYRYLGRKKPRGAEGTNLMGRDVFDKTTKNVDRVAGKWVDCALCFMPLEIGMF